MTLILLKNQNVLTKMKIMLFLIMGKDILGLHLLEQEKEVDWFI